MQGCFRITNLGGKMQESHFWVFCLETLAEELEKIKNVKTKGGAKQLKVYLVTGYARVRLASFVE